MSVYSNTEITSAINDGTIVCVPFAPSNVSEASLDFTLGHYFFKQEYQEDANVYNPFDKGDVDRYFKGPLEAQPHKEWCDKNGYKLFANIPEDHPIIVLRPGERILAHTHEFVGIRSHGGACEVKSRSSWGRNGVAVCFDAGWVDPGYINRITLEIYNLNMHESVVLPVGERIGQLIFHKTGPVEGDYSDGRGGMSGKYQHTSDLDELIRTWKPEDMLPRAYKDSRKPAPVIAGLAEGMK
ncbi:deoxycytidine triphosphate deaminase [Candidatus Saccharibacteria bacterium RIFCSPHIGHO2_01_FULL_45_15]|nr:MAG: deoxycytidine triphosphate deaminase [Candidatus Saccharibacteria bacterium RIFCSPHIGHO2_01_FULL_45_15]OGL26959.1 MAG: deoxycytidine triphosphate deaminase [Candidatus Saccharibacteria bacterium RIFCSPHIGHO2_02_FULL_46_12]OGL32313.1 MAG: deoxycytidine triphosphate deaminase [Candidatus Saccharibacteria bacterium RIFCSPHIGHO2_12_FULL_44_22]